MSNNDLWYAFKADPNPAIKKQIVLTYMNVVHYVIHNSKFINYDIYDEKDYFQIGIEGLSEAIERFDPDYGTKFETYAIQRVRGKIIDEIRKIVNKQKYKYSDDNILPTVSLNSPLKDDEGFMLCDVIPGESETPEEELESNQAKEYLVKEILKLEERDRLVITLYYYEELSYKEIAEVLGITVSRVSQIHSRIMQKLKKKLATVHG